MLNPAETQNPKRPVSVRRAPEGPGQQETRVTGEPCSTHAFFFAQMHRGPEDGHKVGCGALSASVTESGHTVHMFVHKAAQYETFT